MDTDSGKAAQLVDNPGFQARVMYCVWRHALFTWSQDAPDKQARMDAARAIQADPAKLRLVAMLILTAPGIIGIVDPANGGGEIDDTLLLGQVEENLIFWAQTILGQGA